MNLGDEIKNKSYEVEHADGSKLALISVAEETNLARAHNKSSQEIQLEALKLNILPARYQRNYGTVGLKGQLQLLNSTVGVIGAGGLGGYVVEFLARMGIGNLVVVDDDSFEDNNLNRQLFATEEELNKEKVSTVMPRVNKINRGVEVTAKKTRFTKESGGSILGECDLVIDALDNLSSRYALEKVAKNLGIPMIHGAIGGFIGQVLTIFPEDVGLAMIYPDEDKAPDKLIEVSLGNPTATPPMVASWQVHECVKVLTGIGTPLQNCLLYMDASEGQVELIKLR